MLTRWDEPILEDEEGYDVVIARRFPTISLDIASTIATS